MPFSRHDTRRRRAPVGLRRPGMAARLQKCILTSPLPQCPGDSRWEKLRGTLRSLAVRFLPLEKQWTYLGTASSWLSASWTPIRYLSLLCLSGALQWSTPLYPGKPFRFQYHTCCPEMPDTRPNLKVESDSPSVGSRLPCHQRREPSHSRTSPRTRRTSLYHLAPSGSPSVLARRTFSEAVRTRCSGFGNGHLANLPLKADRALAA